MTIRSATIVTTAVIAAVGISVAFDTLGQQMQKITYKVEAKDTKYTQRHMIEVGDEMGHQVGTFEIHRTFGADAPAVNGIKLKEVWTRGYSDYWKSNGLSTNYTTYVLENGDTFHSKSSTMGQTDAAGRRKTVSVGEILGGTGKVAGIKGTVRSNGQSDGKAGFNETQTEIEYWLAK
jgi:hypothetical protein